MSALSWTGKCSSFGGPNDTGVGVNEGLGLIEAPDLNDWWFNRLFLQSGVVYPGLARRLNPASYYIAMRFGYTSFQGVKGEILPDFTREQVRRGIFFISKAGNGNGVFAQAADFGPNLDTGRLIDCSPAVLSRIGAVTDDNLDVSFIPC